MKKPLTDRELAFYLFAMGRLNKGKTLTYEQAQFLVNIGDDEMFIENPDVIVRLNEDQADTYRNNLEELRRYLELKELSSFKDQADYYEFDGYEEEIGKIIR